MKKHFVAFALVCLSAMMLFTACTQKYPGYKKTQSGLYYKIHSRNTAATQPGYFWVQAVNSTIAERQTNAKTKLCLFITY